MDNNNLLWKYASLGSQLIIGIGLSLYAGMKLDEWLNLKMPITIWLFPLLFITAVIIKLIIETNKKNNQ
jgi:hypothetical protein